MVSIIIPIHNSAAFLHRCLDSIVFQTYKQLEVILVDDGSTDESVAICRKYCSRYSNFKLINNNVAQGVSRARNVGLNISTGEYIVFVDSDDYIDERYIEYLVTSLEINQTDIEICAVVRESPEAEIISKTKRGLEKFFCLDNSYDSLGFYAHRGIWACIFRRDVLLNDTGGILQFSQQISIGEDLLFFTEALSRACRAHYSSDTPYYHYVIYPNSSYHNADLKKMYSNIIVHKKVVDIISNTAGKKARESAQLCLIYKCFDIYQMFKNRNERDTVIMERLISDMCELIPEVFKAHLGLRFTLRWLKAVFWY